MTVTISAPTNGNRTFTFTKTVPSQKLLDMADKAWRYLFAVGYGDHGTPEAPKTFDSLTNAEKLAILDAYISAVLRDAAKTWHITEAIEAVRITAEQSGDFEMGLLPKP